MWRPVLARHLAVYRVPTAVVGTMLSVAVQRRWASNIKMTKQLKKMFDRRSGSKKKKFFPGPVNLSISHDQDLNPRKKSTYTEGQKRRANQVGKVLFDNIVHLINSGAVSAELGNLCVEIVRVKVIPDFSTMNVYWLSSGTAEDKLVETLLSNNAGQLRQLLSSQHIVGHVPRINFVRDNSKAYYTEVESLLKKADFGPDFIPTQLGTSIRENMLSARKVDDPLSPEDQLQREFNQMSLGYVSDHSVGGLMTNLEMGVQKKHNSSGEEKACQDSDVDKSEAAHHLGTAGSVNKSETLQRQILHPDSSPSSSPPSTLDAEQLCSQYFSSNGAEAVDGTHNTPHMKDMQPDLFSTNFRDDLYKVPHSELLKKVLIRKQRISTRPSISNQTKGRVLPVVQSSSFKPSFQKKQKLKGRLKRQSDYFGTDSIEASSRVDNYSDDDYDAFDEELYENYEENTEDNVPKRK